jgi:large subunit ribosomal protein L20
MRVKSPRLHRHKKILKLASGYRMTRNRLYKVAHEAVVHAGQYAFAGRRLRRRDLRATWIIRINAALRELGVTYSRFIAAASKAHIIIDRKILSDLATRQPKVFAQIVKAAGFTSQK